MEPEIYFGTHKGLKAYSLTRHRVRKVANLDSMVFGVTHDPVHDKIYFGFAAEIFRANRDGTNVETVLNTTECAFISYQLRITDGSLLNIVYT